ncbi:MAG: SWIM zinc finger family protein, partial [Deltaproteobacteria bacterium]|nr:SWIM zinc finger family protein [Deltaproteobacteria bacterium]
MKSVEEFFTTVREACDRSVWSRGVELVRANAVDGESCDEDEAILRVSTRGGMICPAVTLYLDDMDWDCDCPSNADPCEHVAASTIALRRARKEGQELPRSSSGSTGAGRLQYTLKRASNGGLSLERAILRDNERYVMKSTLAAISSGRVDGPKFLATPEDLAIERALGPYLSGSLPPGVLKSLLPLLQPCPDVLLEDQPVTISNDPVGPHGVVEDQGDGFRLFIQDDPSIEEHFGANIVRCGNVLSFLNKGRLSGRELSELPRGRHFSADQAPELVTQILPDLSQRIPVERRTTRLPETASEPPRIQIDVTRDGENLSVLPLLVYGTPAVARIDAGRLIPLGDGAIPLRNIGGEERLRNQLRNALGLVPGRRRILPPEEAIDFSQRLEKFRMGEILGDAHEDFFLAPELIPDVSWEDEDLIVRFSSPGGERSNSAPGAEAGEVMLEADSKAVLDAWRGGESLVRLTDGGFAPLPTDWLQRYGPSISDLFAAKTAAGGKLPACALADAAHLCEEFDLPEPEGADKILALAENFAGIPEAPLPEDLRAELRHYQQDGINWLCFLRDAGLGALLADDMGLGKTLQALCALQGHSLVVAPTSVLHNWADEIQHFRPSQRICLYHGPGRQLDPEAEITLTTYSILRLDIDTLKKRNWDVVVLDEAQAVKNPDSQAARAARQLNANFRLALTGTPVENRLEELWSQLHFVNPGLLGGRRDFEQRYAKPISEGDEETAERLRQHLRPFLLRRLKSEV